MNEIVKYDNYMNSLNFKGFTSTDLNFLMVLCSKLREKDVTEIIVPFEELRQKTGYIFTFTPENTQHDPNKAKEKISRIVTVKKH